MSLHAIHLEGTTAYCSTCRWGYADPNADARGRAVARHVGVMVDERPRRPPGCHSVCIGEDQCLIDGDGGD